MSYEFPLLKSWDCYQNYPFAKKSMPDIRDGDGDGFIYDGTEYERPAPKKPTIVDSEDDEENVAFASPNIDEAHYDDIEELGLTEEEVEAEKKRRRQAEFAKAIKRINGYHHANVKSRYADTYDSLGIDAQMNDAVGVWADGAENSIIHSAMGVDHETWRYALAKQGLLSNQKDVIAFTEKKGGSARLFSMVVDSDDLQKISDDAADSGLMYHTIERLRDGKAGVYVFTPDASWVSDESLIGFGSKYGVETIEKREGAGEFVAQGEEKFRSRAALKYREVIRDYEQKASDRGRDEGRSKHWSQQGLGREGHLEPLVKSWDCYQNYPFAFKSKPEIRDGDSDGFIYDGTKYERRADPEAFKRLKAGQVEPKRADVKWRDNADPVDFIEARDKSEFTEFLSHIEPDDIRDHVLFLSEDGTVGVAVSPDGDVQNVFNNGGPKGGGNEAVISAVNSGGLTLDCYDGFLPSFYANFGFVETGRMKFNRDYAPATWNYEKFGEPDVVFMARVDFESDKRMRERSYDKESWKAPERSRKYYEGEQWDEAKQDSIARAEAALGGEGGRSTDDGPRAKSLDRARGVGRLAGDGLRDRHAFDLKKKEPIGWGRLSH